MARHFCRPRRALFVALLLAYFLVQVGHTVTGKANAIFYPYSMFSWTGHRRTEMTARLWLSSGETVEVPASQVLPIDFYRALAICEAALREDGERAHGFSRRVLARLNEAPWGAHDERREAARPPVDRRFVGIDWLKREIAFELVDGRIHSFPSQSRLVFSHREVP